MRDADIVRALEMACATPGLIFQVTNDAGQWSIVINRPREHNPDYSSLKPAVKGAIATHLPADCSGFWLCSRVLGQVEPDWQVYVTLKRSSQTQHRRPPSSQPHSSQEPRVAVAAVASPPTTVQVTAPTASVDVLSAPDPATEAASSNQQIATSAAPPVHSGRRLPFAPDTELVSPAAADEDPPAAPSDLGTDAEPASGEPELSSFCFIRNMALLKSEILPPAEAVARLVSAFDQLPASEQLALLPHLDSVFRATPNRPHNVDPAQLTEEAQSWFEQLTQLTAAQLRKVAIWMSRYCYTPEATIAEVQGVLNPAAAPSPEPPPTGTGDQASPTVSPAPQDHIPDESGRSKTISLERQRRMAAKAEQRKFAAQRRYLALMATWMVLVFALVVFRAKTVDNAAAIAKSCRDTLATQESCQLTAQLIGTRVLDTAKQKAQTTTEVAPSAYEDTEIFEGADWAQDLGHGTEYLCEKRGNLNAGVTLREMSKKSHEALSKSHVEIFPGIYLAQVEQVNYKANTPDEPASGNQSVRTACVIVAQAQTFAILAAEPIPLNWPDQAYTDKPMPVVLAQATEAYGVFAQFGARTLFTALGLFVSALTGLALSFSTMNGIILSAFVLQTVEFILDYIVPIRFPLLGNVALMTLALFITSCCIKQFEIDWSNGYRTVAAGALIVLFIRFILDWGLFGLIVYLVQ